MERPAMSVPSSAFVCGSPVSDSSQSGLFDVDVGALNIPSNMYLRNLQLFGDRVDILLEQPMLDVEPYAVHRDQVSEYSPTAVDSANSHTTEVCASYNSTDVDNVGTNMYNLDLSLDTYEVTCSTDDESVWSASQNHSTKATGCEKREPKSDGFGNIDFESSDQPDLLRRGIKGRASEVDDTGSSGSGSDGVTSEDFVLYLANIVNSETTTRAGRKKKSLSSIVSRNALSARANRDKKQLRMEKLESGVRYLLRQNDQLRAKCNLKDRSIENLKKTLSGCLSLLSLYESETRNSSLATSFFEVDSNCESQHKARSTLSD